MAKQKTVDQMNVKELEQAMREYGSELARLLNAAPLPDEQKAAWASLVPHMDLAQLDKLTQTLLELVDAEVKKQFAPELKQLKEILDTHDQAQEAAAKETLGQLDAIMQQVKDAESAQ